MSKPIRNEALLRSAQQGGLAMASEAVVNLDLNSLLPHPQNDIVYSSVADQMRIIELADNIELHGQIDTLVVMKHPDADKPGMYMIISGHRRWNALKLLANDRKLVVYEKARCVVRSFGSYEESVLYLISCNSTQRQLSDYSIFMQAQTAIQAIEKMRLNNDPLVRGRRSAVLLADMMNVGHSLGKTLIHLSDILDENLMTEFKNGNITFNMIDRLKKLDDASKVLVIEEIKEGEHTVQFNRKVLSSHLQEENSVSGLDKDVVVIKKDISDFPSVTMPTDEIALKKPLVEKPLVRKTVTGKVTPVKIREALIRSVNKVRVQVVEDVDIDKNFLEKIDLVINFIETTL